MGLWIILWLVLASKAEPIMAAALGAVSSLALDATDVVGSPQVLSVYLKWAFLLLALWALWRLVRVALTYFNTYYTITTQRLRVRAGIMSQEYVQMELFRVKDFVVSRSFAGRLFGYSHVHIVSSDRLVPTLDLVALPGSVEMVGQIRQTAQRSRSETGLVTIRE